MGISGRQNIGIEKMPKIIQAAGIAAILLILENSPNHLVPLIIIIERENTSDANSRKKIIKYVKKTYLALLLMAATCFLQGQEK
jgi:hypothetical protein